MATLQLSKPFDGSSLTSALKVSTLGDLPKVLSVFLSVVMGWLGASLSLLVSSNPVLAVLGAFVPELSSIIASSLASSISGVTVSPVSMTLTKAWDVSALLSELKSQGIPAGEQLLLDDVQVLFQWLQQSLSMGNALEQGLGVLVTAIETLAINEIKAIIP